MFILKKILTIVVFTAVIAFGAYFVDVKVINHEEEIQAPDVSISKTFLEPLVLAPKSKSFLEVCVKGDAGKVEAQIAKRIGPAKGDDVLETYSLESGGQSMLEANTNFWTYEITAPEEEGQYLLTAFAYDKNERSTKRMLFDTILKVKKDDGKKVVDDFGKQVIFDFYEAVNEKDFGKAYDLYSEGFRKKQEIDGLKKIFEKIARVDIIDMEQVNFFYVLNSAQYKVNKRIFFQDGNIEEAAWYVTVADNPNDKETGYKINAFVESAR
ncbi:MAG: hypothetical protein ACD_63C00217G0003 [uncultured bacterium]|nr:MAG: hypothetical protein ACD_63C00217G0003 [uncultured bacterium]